MNINNDAIIGLNSSMKNSGRLSSESKVNNLCIITNIIPVKDPQIMPIVKNNNTWYGFLLFNLFIFYRSFEKQES